MICDNIKLRLYCRPDKIKRNMQMLIIRSYDLFIQNHNSIYVKWDYSRPLLDIYDQSILLCILFLCFSVVRCFVCCQASFQFFLKGFIISIYNLKRLISFVFPLCSLVFFKMFFVY